MQDQTIEPFPQRIALPKMAVMELHKAIGTMLAGLGTTMFGVMGDANLHIVSTYRSRGGRYVRAVHESGAVTMADAHHRAGGQLTLATVTHGPGLTNALTGLTEAVRARSQVLLVSGTTPLDPHHDQRIDVAQVARTAGAAYERIYTPDSAGRDVSRALQRARGDRIPVLLDVPAHLLHERCTRVQVLEPTAAAEPRPPRESELDGALGLLTAANRPIIVAGRGAVVSGAAPALVTLAENTGALLAASVLAKDIFAGEKRSIGIMGNLAHDEAQQALSEADCIVSFGAALNSMTTVDGDLVGGKKIVHVDIDPAAINLYTRVDEAVVGDAGAVAKAMNAMLAESGWAPEPSGWVERTASAVASRAELLTDEHVVETFIDVRAAAMALNDVLPKNFALISDVGRYNAGTWPYIHVADPRDFLGISAFGSIGLGLAGAVGAGVARPGLPVVLLVGDGGLMMSVGELTTAVREALPLIIVVLNDDAYGYEHFRLVRYGFDAAYSKNDFADFTGIAGGFGIESRTIRTVADLEGCSELWREGLTGPVLLDVKIDPFHNLIL